LPTFAPGATRGYTLSYVRLRYANRTYELKARKAKRYMLGELLKSLSACNRSCHSQFV